MTVNELINELQALKKRNSGFGNAAVYVVKDWSQMDEYGYVTGLSEVITVFDQTRVIDTGLDFIDEPEVLLEAQEG